MPATDRVQAGNREGLRIWLLGRFRVCNGSRLVEECAWRRRKAAAIIKLIALAPQQRLHREQIMDLLWRDFEPRAAANNLRRTLHAARRALDPSAGSPSPYLRGDPLTLCSDVEVWVDVEAFEAAGASARRTQAPASYRAAIDLYTGDLLAEDRYEDWAAVRREELRWTYQSLLMELAQLYEERNETGPAIEILQRVVAHEPAHEDAHVALMRLYARSGQRYQALQQYHQLREALLREVDTQPDSATRHVYEDILERRFPVPVDDSPSTAPSIRRHNLPVPVTAFIGREREIGEVTRLLGQARLVTLTGPGGCGKTRLAQKVASRLVDTYLDGVWLVELAALGDPDLVPQAVASVLGVREQPGVQLNQTLVNTLESRHVLLILDNCEHLVDACAALANSLLRACQHLRILITTRQALGIAGEQVWRVPSLELPDARRLPSIDEIAASEAVRLFVDRAHLSRSGFALVKGNAAAAAEVCQRLDGMPLAIELAAARLHALSVQQIAALLDDRLRLLAGGSRAALPRQQTLRATVDWSYDLLSEAEGVLFDRLSVFAGGWALEAAETVCSGPDIPPERVLDLLASLVDQSLVLAEADDGDATRYHMLETLRQYGRERLVKRGEAQAVQRCHANYYFALAEAAEPELTGPQQVAWLDRLEREHANLRAALRWSLDGDRPETAARLCGALGWFWYEHNHLREGRRWMDDALSICGTLPEYVQAKLLMWAGFLAVRQGDSPEGQEELKESLGLWQALGDRQGEAVVLNMLGSAARYQGDAVRATGLYEAGLAVAQDAGDTRNIALSLDQLGRIARFQGDYARADSLCEQSLMLFREVGDHRRIAGSLMHLASLAAHSGDLSRALALYKEGLELVRTVREGNRIAEGLEGVANVAFARGQPVRAARLFGAAVALRDAIGIPVPPAERTAYERRISAVRDRLDDTEYAVAWSDGQAMTAKAWDEAIQYALALG